MGRFVFMFVILPVLLVIVAIYLRFNEKEPYFQSYKQYGNPADPTVLIIPGLDGCTSFFSDIIPDLTPYFNVVVFNIPLAPSPFNCTKHPDYTFRYLASAAAQVMDAAGVKRAHVVGESFGGVIAQRLALDFPDRVDKLIVLSSLAKTNMPPEIAFKANYLLPFVRGFGLLFPGLAQTLFAYLHVDDVVEPSEPQWAKDFFKKEASWAHHYSVMKRLSIVIPLDMLDEVKKIDHHTLILYGADDHFTGKDSEVLFKAIPHSLLKSLPGGHLAHLVNPKAFVEVVKQFIFHTM